MVSSTPWPHFTPRKDPVPILQEAGWAPGPVWMGGKSHPHRDSIPDCPAHSQSRYRPGYLAHAATYTDHFFMWSPPLSLSCIYCSRSFYKEITYCSKCSKWSSHIKQENYNLSSSVSLQCGCVLSGSQMAYSFCCDSYHVPNLTYIYILL